VDRGPIGRASIAICRRRRIAAPLIALVAAALYLTLSGWWYGWHLIEKILTRLAMPTGLLFLGLLVCTYLACWDGRRFLSRPLVGLTLAFWLVGNTLTSQWIIGRLERRYAHVNVAEISPFDVVIVLGGGTMSNSAGDVWLGNSGDRLALAARLYHQGKARRLITLGEAYGWAAERLVSPSRATAQIWTELGIAREAILQIGETQVRNTSEEMRQLKRWLQRNPAQRVGLITSAFHMPRAERLARLHGLEVIPLASSFHRPRVEPWPLAVLPSFHSLQEIDLSAKEYLAAVLQR
jgi:uncharacterized SAM-binding protein YcdF (DUF218 family)